MWPASVTVHCPAVPGDGFLFTSEPDCLICNSHDFILVDTLLSWLTCLLVDDGLFPASLCQFDDDVASFGDGRWNWMMEAIFRQLEVNVTGCSLCRL